MKTNFLKNYKKIFVLWVAIGMAISGYFFIFPIYHTVYSIDDFFVSGQPPSSYSEKGQHFEVSILITMVGAVLIGGLGYVSDSKN